jgi:asparagine synthase (glutamine-hydrolysing)
MCGIVGFAFPDGNFSKFDIHNFANVLSHRGPDEYGEYSDKNVSLGMRRLSIIDVCNGHQPVFSEDESIISVFNGQIYNFQKLRHDLQDKGHKFKSNSDSEIIPHLFEEFGPSFVSRIEGMFAIAIWDKTARTLHLYRDRLGKKPLIYQSTREGSIYFASEMKALYSLEKPTVSSVDIDSVATFLAFGHTSNPKTIINNVFKLPPATHLKWSDGVIEISNFWTPKIGNNVNSFEENVVYAKTLIESAIKKRLVSERPLGAFLSGGIDSSLIVAMMSPHVKNLKTFSVGFHESDFDESKFANVVAQKYHTDHTQIYLNQSEIADTLFESVKFYDEPFADSSSLPTFYLSKIAAQQVTVALSGDGGDEAFGGYQRYVLYKKFANFFPMLFLAQSLRAQGLLSDFLFPKRILRGLNAIPGQYSRAGMYEAMMTLIGSTNREALLKPEFKKFHINPHLDFLSRMQEFKELPNSLAANLQDIHSYLPDDLMFKVDIASMAHSLEVRSPFLDSDVVEFGLSLPESQRVGRFGKVLLRDLAAQYLPNNLIDRPKMGFGIPRQKWLQTTLAPLVDEVFLDRHSIIYNWIDYGAANRILSEFKATKNNDGVVWSILVFELWAREWLA